jgi:hypothetical protein
MSNEISAAPRLLKSPDLRGKVVTGDAMLAQRELSLQIVAMGGDYIWTVQDNPSTLRQAIELLFQPEQAVKGFSPGPKDFRRAQPLEKAPGREERRSLTVRAEWKGIWIGPIPIARFTLSAKNGKWTFINHDYKEKCNRLYWIGLSLQAG